MMIRLFVSAEMAAAAGPKRTRQTYTRYQTLELEKVSWGRFKKKN